MAGDPIGRADYELRAPIDPLKKDLAAAKSEIQKTGAATEEEFARQSSKWGPVLATGVKTGIKTVAVAAAGMFAIAAKGADQLQQVQNDYQAATGASAEEARRAGKVINKAAGENQLALESVRDAAIAVHNDLGAVGDQADELTNRFATFGRVTQQAPVAAVKAFDDILDAWNLTADDSKKVMDVLVVSHQKYGGAVADDQAALAGLAPALKAMNGTWQDAVALIDLAKASGLNTADAITGLNKALGKVKSPQELQKLIDDISNTTDPFLRAQKAADLFGQKAGPKLANALAGRTLKDFNIDVEAAAGATDNAAEALDHRIGPQMHKKISEFGAALRGLGGDWGPVLTGAGSLISVLGAIGADEIFKKLGPPIIEGFKRAGTAGGEALVDAAGTATGAAGTIFGNIIADPIAAALDPDRNSLLGRLVRGSGDKLATAYLKVLIAGDVLAGAMSAAWAKLITIPAFAAAVEAAGAASAAVFSAAATTAFIAAPIVVAWAFSTIPHDGRTNPGANTLDAGALAFAPPKIDENAWKQALAGVDWTSITGPAQKSLVGNFGRIGQKAATALGDGVKVQAHTFHNTVQIFTKQGLAAMKTEARLAGLRSAEALAQGILDARQKPLDAFETLKEMLKHPLTKMKEQSRLLGELTSKELAKGLRSKDPAIRDQAKATKAYIIDRLTELKTGSGKLTKEQAALVNKGLRSKDADIRAAAQRIKHFVETPLAQLRDKGFVYGQGFTNGFIRGLVADIDRVRANAALLSRAVRDYLQVRSPSKEGAFSELGGPEGWSKHWMTLYTKGLAAGVPRINGILGGLGGFSVPMMTTAAAALNTVSSGAAQSSSVSRGTTVSIAGGLHLHGVGSDVSPAAAQRFGRQVLDEVARGFREGGARRGFTTTVRP